MQKLPRRYILRNPFGRFDGPAGGGRGADDGADSRRVQICMYLYARRMGQPTQKSKKLYGKVKHRSSPVISSRQRPKRARPGGARDVDRGAGSHTPSTASDIHPSPK